MGTCSGDGTRHFPEMGTEPLSPGSQTNLRERRVRADSQFRKPSEALRDGPCMMYPTGKDCGRESTEHNTAAPDTWPRVRDCAYGQADAVRTGTARCAGPDPCCSGLSMIPPVTRCVVVDLAPQAMIGRVWVCAGSIMTDKTHRQGAITRCIHATECQAAVPWFTFTTFTVAHVQFGMHAARAHPHKHMRMCSSAYELHFDVSTTPRRACAAEKRRFARQLVHDDFAFVLQREIDMLVVRAHDHMHMRMCSSAH